MPPTPPPHPGPPIAMPLSVIQIALMIRGGWSAWEEPRKRRKDGWGLPPQLCRFLSKLSRWYTRLMIYTSCSGSASPSLRNSVCLLNQGITRSWSQKTCWGTPSPPEPDHTSTGWTVTPPMKVVPTTAGGSRFHWPGDVPGPTRCRWAAWER